EQVDLDRRVRDDLEKLLVAPDVVLERRHVQVADSDAAQPLARPGVWTAGFEPAGHLAVEVELMGELLVLVGIGDVATRGYIEVVEQDRIAADIKRDLDVPAILLAATMVQARRSERYLGDNGDAVVGLHALHQPVLVAEGLE